MTNSRSRKQYLWSLFVSAAFSSTLALGQEPVLVSGWPRAIDVTANAPIPVIADIDGDGLKDILIPAGVDGVQAFCGNGTLIPGWESAPCATGQVFVGNLVGDANLEVVVHCSTAIGFRAFSAEGTELAGWPIVSPQISSSFFFCLADIDGDQYDELVALDRVQDLQVHAYKGDGTAVPGWPVNLQVPASLSNLTLTRSGLAAADVDCDGAFEVLTTFQTLGPAGPDLSPVWLHRGDGSLQPGWPDVLPQAGSIFAPVSANLLKSTPGPEVVCTRPIGLVGYEASGEFSILSSITSPNEPYAAVADLDGDGVEAVIVPGLSVKVLQVSETNGDSQFVVTHESPATPFFEYRGLTVGDVDGDGDMEIACWSIRDEGDPLNGVTALHLFDHMLNELPGFPMVFSPYFTPWFNIWSTAMADLDGDGDAELVHTTQDQLYAWDFPQAANFAPRPPQWPMHGGSSRASHQHMPDVTLHRAFVRGDANGNGTVDVADVVGVVKEVFGLAQSSCSAALDFNLDRALDAADAICLLNYLFLLGEAPAPPFPECFAETCPGHLTCETSNCP